MESSSVDARPKARTRDPTRARDESRRVAAREAERGVQLLEENARREAAKVDASRGNQIDTFA
jgi:hypothetical protein